MSMIGPKSVALAAAIAMLIACGGAKEDHGHPHAENGGRRARALGGDDLGRAIRDLPRDDPLVAGSTSSAHTHVTVLSDFSPLRQGSVSIVLRGSGAEQSFAGTFKRDGIYDVPIAPAREGVYDLLFASTPPPAGRRSPGAR